MSYASRLNHYPNPPIQNVVDQKPFFSRQQDINKTAKSKAFFQAKYSVNQPGDSYEREADSVANAVVNKSPGMPVVQQNTISSIQRLATTPEEESVSTNDERMERDKEKPFQLQKKNNESGNASTAPQHVSSKIESSAGKGSKLPQKTLHEMNSSFGTDFTNVHIHNDSESAEMSKDLRAHAFTHGNDIYFNSGKYNPENSDGKFLLAHELMHVMQQNTSIQEKKVQRYCEDGAWQFEYDGCSVPWYIVLLIGSSNKDNPALGIDTQFSNLVNGPCDLHDECYQTCGMSQEDCDKMMYNKMMAVCDSSTETSETKGRCYHYAGAYYMGLRAFGGSTYSDRQSQSCGCKENSNPSADQA